jgi:hypothetical protein
VTVIFSLREPAPMLKAVHQETQGIGSPAVQPVQETVAGVTYVAARAPQGAFTFTIDLK